MKMYCDKCKKIDEELNCAIFQFNFKGIDYTKRINDPITDKDKRQRMIKLMHKGMDLCEDCMMKFLDFMPPEVKPAIAEEIIKENQ